MNPTKPLPPGEAHPCFVGSGECLVPAAFVIDDGAGNPDYICAHHLLEFEYWEKRFATMGDHKLEQLEAAIAEQEMRLRV